MRASMSTARRPTSERAADHPARPHDARLPRGHRRGHGLRLPGHPPGGAAAYRQQIVRQMLEIGYYSLPVVGLTAIFTGMVLALQSYTGFARFSAESAIPNVVVVSLTRELGPVLAGPHGGRPGRRGDGGRDRHHAGHRADRRAHHAVDRPVQVPGGAAADRRHRHPADPGAARRHHRRAGRLPGRRLQARLQRRGLSAQHARLPAVPGRLLRPGEGRGVRLPDHADGLLPRLHVEGRRPGRRHGDDQRRGLGLDPDPDLQLLHHRSLLRAI